VSGSGGDARGSESGVTLVPLSGTHGKNSEMDDRYGLRSVDSQQWLDQARNVVDAKKRGSPVSSATWDGRELPGTVCDREHTGLLSVVRETGDSTGGYVFCRGLESSRWRFGR